MRNGLSWPRSQIGPLQKPRELKSNIDVLGLVLFDSFNWRLGVEELKAADTYVDRNSEKVCAMAALNKVNTLREMDAMENSVASTETEAQQPAGGRVTFCWSTRPQRDAGTFCKF